MQNHMTPANHCSKRSLFWMVLFIGTILFSSPGAAWSKTVIAGVTINGNTTWTLDESPYEVSGAVQIGDGGTLTVETGVVVKFAAEAEIGIEVLSGGSLVADGSAAAPVIFTDLRDDSAGGDTNEDGDLTSPEPGAWDGIVVNDGGNATLHYAHVRYGYGGVFKTGNGLLTMEDCIVTDSFNDGLYLFFTSDTNTISRCTFSQNYQGIWIWGPSGNVIVDGCMVSENTYGMTIMDALGSVSLDKCTVSENTYGMRIWDTLGSVSLSECMVSDNGGYGIEISDISNEIMMGGMTVRLTAGISVSHSTVSNNDGPGIRIDNNSPLITNNTITGNTVGIECKNDANPLIGGSPDNRNNIFKNTTFGVNNLSPDVTINATHNWWGDYLGPTHPPDSEGKGDNVSDNVNFSDFALISALAGDLNNDNGIGLEDVIVGLQVMTGMTPAILFHPEYAIAGIDVNGDGLAGLAEAIYDLRDVAGFNE